MRFLRVIAAVSLLFGLSLSAFAQTFALMPDPRFRGFDINGIILPGGKVCTYQAGTTTPLATYTDSTGGTPNANPVILDSQGYANIWLSANAYKIVLLTAGSDSTCSTGVQQWSVDNVSDIGQLLKLNAIISNPAANASQSISGPLSLGTFGFTAGNGTLTSVNGVLNASRYSGADIGAQFNSAEASADCPSTGCEIHIPAGTGNYNFSTQISFSKTILLVCDGIGGMANGGLRQNTTLTWTGGASAAILISGSSATASKIKGCALNNTGSATIGIDLDSGANDVQLEDVPIVLPTVPFSVAAFRVGNTGIVVNPQFTHTVARAAAPIGYDILNVQSHFVGIKMRANSNTVADMILGQASSSVQSFDCYGCIFETASGVNSAVFQRVEGAHFYGGYDEAGGVATVYPFDIPATTTLARNISFDGMFFSCLRATCPNGAVHSNFGSAQVNIKNSYQLGYVAGNSLFQNDSSQKADLEGNDLFFTGGLIASSMTNVDQCGNTIASVHQVCTFAGQLLNLAADFTTANNTNLQLITGMTWTLPANIAQNVPFSCHLAYSQATANVAVAFGIQAQDLAPTNIFATGLEQTNTTAFTGGNLPTLSTTTATAIVSATPGALATVFNVDLNGFIENPSGVSNRINIMVSTAAGADAVTVKRGSFCKLY